MTDAGWRPRHGRFIALAFAGVVGIGPALAVPPPIACGKAAGPAEHEICNDPTLVAMDREIAALYDRGLAELQGPVRHQLVLSQQAFLKKRNGCAWAAHHSAHPGVAVDECVRTMMDARVRALRAIADGAQF